MIRNFTSFFLWTFQNDPKFCSPEFVKFFSINRTVLECAKSGKVKGFSSYSFRNTIIVMKQKNKMHSEWKIFNNIGDYTTFQLLRSRSEQLIKNNFNDNLYSVQLKIKSNCNRLFNFVAVKRRELTIPNSVSSDNMLISVK